MYVYVCAGTAVLFGATIVGCWAFLSMLLLLLLLYFLSSLLLLLLLLLCAWYKYFCTARINNYVNLSQCRFVRVFVRMSARTFSGIK